MRLGTHTYAGIVVMLLFSLVVAVRVYAAEISDVTISSITDNSASVEWTTDQNTDATINYGLDSAVGIVRDPTFNSKSHSLKLVNLEPSTTYHFRVISTDGSGNKTATGGLVLTTKIPNNPDLDKITKTEEKALAAKILAAIDKLTDPEALKAVEKKVKQAESDIIRPPSIIGSPKVVANTSGADISWSSDRESNSQVDLVSDAQFDSTSKDSYTIHQGDSKESVKKHVVSVIGLDPSTTYHFRVSSSDSGGLSGASDDDTFMTKSTLPTVLHATISRVQETSGLVTWDTGDVLAKGLVTYTNLRTKITKISGTPVFAQKQSILLTGLEFGTKYSVMVTATNKGGDEAFSKPLSFITVRDVVPPAISKVTNESTLYPTEDVKIQTILSWETDEPADCQVSYMQGLVHAAGEAGDSLPAETNPLTAHTQVIVGFAPATVYKFWMHCADVAGNASQSDDYVLITPIKEKSIIDVILQNFQGTFGWVNKIGK